MALIAASTAGLRGMENENWSQALMPAVTPLPDEYAQSPRTGMVAGLAPAAVAVVIASATMLAAPLGRTGTAGPQPYPGHHRGRGRRADGEGKRRRAPPQNRLTRDLRVAERRALLGMPVYRAQH